MGSLLCRVFGHRWAYGITMDIPRRVFRTCRHCPIVQEAKRIFPQKRAWVTMVQWTDSGARDALGPFYEKQGRTQ